jgi:hypothetical protein
MAGLLKSFASDATFEFMLSVKHQRSDMNLRDKSKSIGVTCGQFAAATTMHALFMTATLVVGSHLRELQCRTARVPPRI